MYMFGCANPKGGVGKSFISWMLAGHYDSLDYKVAIWDMDTKQTSCTYLHSKGNVNFDVLPYQPKEGYDILIVDHPPVQLEKVYGDIIISPLTASSVDDDAMERSKSQYQDRPVVYVVNKLSMRSGIQKHWANYYWKHFKALWLKHRTVFEEAIQEGITVQQMPKRRTSVREAINEIDAIATRAEIWLENQS